MGPQGHGGARRGYGRGRCRRGGEHRFGNGAAREAPLQSGDPLPRRADLSEGKPPTQPGEANELASLKQELQAAEQKLAAVQARITPGPNVTQGRVAVIDSARCTACGICASSCTKDAISVNEVAHVDTSLCSGCGACAYVCPSNAIRMENQRK